jgi:hypothetical protein
MRTLALILAISLSSSLVAESDTNNRLIRFSEYVLGSKVKEMNGKNMPVCSLKNETRWKITIECMFILNDDMILTDLLFTPTMTPNSINGWSLKQAKPSKLEIEE